MTSQKVIQHVLQQNTRGNPKRRTWGLWKCDQVQKASRCAPTTADVQQNSRNRWESLTASNRKPNSNWPRHKPKGGRPPQSTSWFTDQPRPGLLPSFCSAALLLASSPSCVSSWCSAGCQKQPEQVLLCSDLAGKSLASPSQQVSISSRLIAPPLAQKCL